MKKLLFISLAFVSTNVFCQELAKNFTLKINKKSAVFQIVEQEKKQFSLFFSDDDFVKTIKFNADFDVIDSLSAAKPDKKFDDIDGYSITGNKYYTYWTSRNNKEIAVQCFDFDSKKITNENINLSILKGKKIKTISINNVFYLITIEKNSNILNFYVFNEGKLTTKTVDLSDKKFINAKDRKADSFWEVLDYSTFKEPSLSTQDILSDLPVSLIMSAKKRKIYTYKNNLIFTNDNSLAMTQVLKIDLTDFSVVLKSINTPFYDINEFDTPQSNSFLLEDKLIQIKLNSERMTLVIKDLEGTEIKSYEVLEDIQIPSKNSEIISENKSAKNTGTLSSSNKFISSIAKINSSVSCYIKDNKIILTLGGISEIQQSYISVGGGLVGALTGELINAALDKRNGIDFLNSYKNRYFGYMNYLFDKNFEQLEEAINKLPFDNLRVFNDANSKDQFKTIFKFENNLILGGYNKETSQYSFHKFKD